MIGKVIKIGDTEFKGKNAFFFAKDKVVLAVIRSMNLE